MISLPPVKYLFLFQPLKENRFVIPKSRFESVSTYLSPGGKDYSNIDLVYDQDIYQQLIFAGKSYPMARTGHVEVTFMAMQIVVPFKDRGRT